MATATGSSTVHAMLDAANTLWPFSKATAILDNGCGPGPVTKRLLKDHGSELPDSCRILCSDFAEGMIAAADANKAQGGKEWERVDTVVQNCMDLKAVADASQSHVLAGFVYFMTPDPMKCLAESQRVLRPEGVLSVSSWKGSQWMDVMMLVKQVRPDKVMPAVPEAWTTAEGVKGEFEKAGFRDVGAREVEALMGFERVEDLVDLILEKMPHVKMMKSDMSEEEVGRLKTLMVEETEKLSDGQGHPGLLKGVSVVGWGRK